MSFVQNNDGTWTWREDGQNAIVPVVGAGGIDYNQDYGLGGYNYNLNWFQDTPTQNGYGAGGFRNTNDLQSVDSLIAQGIGVNNPFGIYDQPTTDAGGNRAIWTQDSSGQTVLRTLPPGGYDPNNPIPNLEIDEGRSVFDPSAMLQGLGGQNGIGAIIPLPIDPLTALAATALLNKGNIFGGGGGNPITGIVNGVTDIVTDPLDTLKQTGENLSNGAGLLDPNGGGLTNAGLVVGGAAGSSSGGNISVGSGATGGAVNDTQTQGGGTIVGTGGNNSNPDLGGALGGSTEKKPDANAVLGSIFDANKQISQTNQDGTTASTTIVPSQINNPDRPSAVNVGEPGTTGTSTIIPTTPNTPTTPTTPFTPAGIIPITSTKMDTTISSPLDRNYYNEGLTASNALNSLTPNITNVYGNASNSYGMADYRNFGDILKQYGITNAGLTGLANQQTFDSNSALRSSNLRDVGNMAGQAYGIQKQYNPGLYGSLDRYQQGANDLLSKTSANLNAQNYLTPQEIDQAQQTARAAWSARGLVNSPGAVGAEILGVDSAWRQRQQEAFANQGNALQSYGQQAAMQSANQFNPFSTILGAQYGQQTQNVGTNQNLYQNVGGFSSGQMGNQFVEQAFNPFNNYANDVFGSNFNAANARSISSANNAAAIQAGKAVSNSNYADMFMNALYGIGTQKGWFKP